MKYKAVIFDLDGTLIHTDPEYRYKVVGDTLKELGVLSFKYSHADQFWFETDRDEIIKRCFRQEPKFFWEIYTKKERTETRRRFIKAYSDIACVGKLKEAGYKIGIVTGSPEKITALEVSVLGKQNFDSVVIARRSTGIPKPRPEGLEKCLSALGAKKQEGLFVGNAEEDVLTAKNAGILDVFLERGEYDFKLDKIQPSMIINSLYGLRSILNF